MKTENRLKIENGYHPTRGSIVDLTIIDSNGNELDMGSKFDFFSTISWPSDKTVGPQARGKVRLFNRIARISHDVDCISSNITCMVMKW